MSRDPLAGYRKAINDGTVKALTFDGNKPCPVNKGDRFRLRSCEIVIDEVEKKRTLDGREWVVRWTRIERDRLYLLRRSVGGNPPRDEYGAPIPLTPDGMLISADVKSATIDGNYTESEYVAVTDEPEAIDPEIVEATAIHQQGKIRDRAERERRAAAFRSLPLADQVRLLTENIDLLNDKHVRSELRQLQRTTLRAAEKLGIAA